MKAPATKRPDGPCSDTRRAISGYATRISICHMSGQNSCGLRGLSITLQKCFKTQIFPSHLAPYEKTLPPPCQQDQQQLDSLYDRFAGMIDQRKGKGKRHRIATVLSHHGLRQVCRASSGGYRHIYRYACGLKKLQRRALRCWINPHDGTYEVPSESCFFRVMRNLDRIQFESTLTAWQNGNAGPASQEFELVAIDGKTVSHSGVHLTGAVSLPSMRSLGVEPVPDKTQ